MGERQMAGNFEAALERSDQIDITVTGRNTGRQITLPVWFVTEGGQLYLVPVRGSDSDWYKNLLATPRMELTGDGQSITATAKPISPDRVGGMVDKFRQKYGADQVAAYYPKTDVAVEVDLPARPANDHVAAGSPARLLRPRSAINQQKCVLRSLRDHPAFASRQP